jgi:hypothetical protein
MSAHRRGDMETHTDMGFVSQELSTSRLLSLYGFSSTSIPIPVL